MNKIVAYKKGKKWPKGTTQIRVEDDSSGADIVAYNHKGVKLDSPYLLSVRESGIYRYTGFDGDAGIAMSKDGNRVKNIKD
jgi:hypothetical protein